jgi:hypothetical protein
VNRTTVLAGKGPLTPSRKTARPCPLRAAVQRSEIATGGSGGMAKKRQYETRISKLRLVEKNGAGHVDGRWAAFLRRVPAVDGFGIWAKQSFFGQRQQVRLFHTAGLPDGRLAACGCSFLRCWHDHGKLDRGKRGCGQQGKESSQNRALAPE